MTERLARRLSRERCCDLALSRRSARGGLQTFTGARSTKLRRHRPFARTGTNGSSREPTGGILPRPYQQTFEQHDGADLARRADAGTAVRLPALAALLLLVGDIVPSPGQGWPNSTRAVR